MSKNKTVPVTEKIRTAADDIRTRIMRKQKASMSTPIRSLANVKFQAQKGYFEMLGKNKHCKELGQLCGAVALQAGITSLLPVQVIQPQAPGFKPVTF